MIVADARVRVILHLKRFDLFYFALRHVKTEDFKIAWVDAPIRAADKKKIHVVFFDEAEFLF